MREDLVLLRPNHGFDARSLDDIVGRVAVADTPAFAALVLEDE